MAHRLTNSLRLLPGLLGRGGTYLVLQLRSLASHLLNICALFYRLLVTSFSSLTGLPLLERELVQQVYFSSIQGMPVLIFGALMLGFLVIVHATPQLAMVQGEEFIGWLLVTIVVRDVGPVLAAFFVLLHSGSAITVKIGTMSVTREVETLELQGIDPYRLLGVPRFWAITLSVLSLYILAAFSSILGGFLFSQLFAEIFWGLFWLSFLNSLEWVDVAMGFTKCVAFGMLIATVCIFFGFQARQDMEEVARFTSRATLTALVLCALVDIILTTVYYL
jgi:phospholipid/cholesterol/gamma-HCH transport system permease protein